MVFARVLVIALMIADQVPVAAHQIALVLSRQMFVVGRGLLVPEGSLLGLMLTMPGVKFKALTNIAFCAFGIGNTRIVRPLINAEATRLIFMPVFATQAVVPQGESIKPVVKTV